MATDMTTNNNQLESVLTRSILNLEEIDRNIYRGSHLWKGRKSVFGGQVVGQALVAAGKTVTNDLHVHSLHCYFVRRGVDEKPILYHVEEARNGRSYCTRMVEARQSGDVIFTMLVSYHKQEEYELQFQLRMPVVPAPEKLPSMREIYQSSLQDESLSPGRREQINSYLSSDIPIEMKPVDSRTYIRTEAAKESKTYFWVKTNGHISESEYNMHRCVAAYISDYGLLRSALAMWPNFKVTHMTSLDHVMWFHSPFRADQWMLYECETTRSIGGRSLVLGKLWRQDGVLAASVAQEGVVRGHFRKSSKL